MPNAKFLRLCVIVLDSGQGWPWPHNPFGLWGLRLLVVFVRAPARAREPLRVRAVIGQLAIARVPVIAGIATAFAAIAAVIGRGLRKFLAHGLNGHRDLREAVGVHVVCADEGDQVVRGHGAIIPKKL